MRGVLEGPTKDLLQHSLMPASPLIMRSPISALYCLFLFGQTYNSINSLGSLVLRQDRNPTRPTVGFRTSCLPVYGTTNPDPSTASSCSSGLSHERALLLSIFHASTCESMERSAVIQCSCVFVFACGPILDHRLILQTQFLANHQLSVRCSNH